MINKFNDVESKKHICSNSNNISQAQKLALLRNKDNSISQIPLNIRFIMREKNICTVSDLHKAVTNSQLFSKVNISPSARILLKCLIDFIDIETLTAFTKQENLAKCTGICRQNICEHINELVKHGLIEKNKKGRGLEYRLTYKLFSYFNEGMESTYA